MRPVVGLRRVGGLVLVASLIACSSPSSGPASVPRSEIDPPRILDAVGRALPAWRFATREGDTVAVLANERSGLVMLVHSSDCFGCTAVTAEAWGAFRIARARGMEFTIVMTGPDTAIIQEFVSSERLPAAPLIDRGNAVSSWFGEYPHPSVLWVGRDRKLLGVYPRTATSAPGVLEAVFGEIEAQLATRRPSS